MDQQAYYTTSEVAELLHVNQRTVTQWIRRGVLTAGKTPGGKCWRIPAAEVARIEYTPAGPSRP